MNTLDSSWDLEKRLKEITCSKKLKTEIILFIEINHKKYVGKALSISNIIYRGNLHYIEDNINKQGLLEEIKKHNNGN